MARYIATSGSNFKPFTYDEMVKPLQQMTDTHNAAQEAADALAMQSGAIGSMLDDSSPRAKRMYDNYQSLLQSFSNNLYENGLTPGTSAALSNLRKVYGTDITKINSAITKKAEAVKQYDEDLKKDKTLLTDRDPRNLSIDEWLDDPYAGNYNSYSGTMLTTKASMIGENLRRDLQENADAWKRILGNQYFEKNVFTGFHAREIDAAISGLIKGEISGNERIKLLQSAMQNVYNSSGIDSWASPETKAQAYSYIGDGIYSAIGEHKDTIQQNHAYITPYQQQMLDLQRQKIATSQGASSGSVAPNIANLRGNAMNGIADKKQSKDFTDKSNVLDALSTINELKKTGGLRQPNGALTDAANEAVMKLQNSSYYNQLTGGKSHFLRDANLDEVIENLGKEVQGMVTNDHIYSFNVTPAASSNMAKNVFKLNIGQLSGKSGDAIAEAVAKYSDGSAVKANDLKAILESNNVSVGFDAKAGKITIQRNASDNSQDVGKYNDKIIYLNPRDVLTGTSGYANAAAIMYAFDAALPNTVSETDRQVMENKIAAMTTVGQTVDLRELAALIHDSYSSLAKSNNPQDMLVLNALVESFAQGLFDSSNTAWSPNNYREGWSQKTGGDYMYDDDDLDY